MSRWSEWKRLHWDDWASFTDSVSGQQLKKRRPLRKWLGPPLGFARSNWRWLITTILALLGLYFAYRVS